MPKFKVVIAGQFEMENILFAPDKETGERMVHEYLSSVAFKSNSMLDIENIASQMNFNVKLKREDEIKE